MLRVFMNILAFTSHSVVIAPHFSEAIYESLQKRIVFPMITGFVSGPLKYIAVVSQDRNVLESTNKMFLGIELETRPPLLK